MVDSTRQFVFVLSETKPLPIVLTIFNAQGEKLFWSASPESAIFYYLTLNQSKEVVVVCNFTVIQNGWHNWFYSWDMKRNALSREGANKQVISSQADSLIKISRIWAD
ncbi:hypothetical protein M8R66_18265, partial [Enterobacter hormaechei]|nr:hypothetical protein [Enterobacter hormaechei]